MQKSQAALEFLTTYGWAFFVIILMVGALYYFGIFDFSKYLPQKCIFPSQFKCLDFSLKPTDVKIKLVNNLGEDICVKSIEITNSANPPISCASPSIPQGNCPVSEFEWSHATEKDVTFASCTGGSYVPDTRAELMVSFSYYSPSTPSKPIHLINGKINGKVASS